MAAYIKLFTDYAETFDELSDAEAGRLIKSILHYGVDGQRRDMQGAERLVYGIICRQIDRENSLSASRSIAGRAGGNARAEKAESASKVKQVQANPSKVKQTQANASKIADKDKDKDNRLSTTEEDNRTTEEDDMCAAASATPVIEIPLNDGSMHPVTQEDVDRWSELYPAVNVMQELRKMVGWCETPRNRKTQNGVTRFITNWLSRTQDKGGSNGYQPGGKPAANPYLDPLL